MSWFVEKLEDTYTKPIMNRKEQFTWGKVQMIEDELEEVSFEEALKILGEDDGSTSTVSGEPSKRE